jgi:CDP-diacylglycerol--glycerol-3-phosphate 3-phosphatidyltransferase
VNHPNQVTLGRLLLSVVLFVLLTAADGAARGAGFWYAAFTLFVVAVLLDSLDGYLARSRGQVTAFGRIADPFADKIVICGVLVLAMKIEQTRSLVPTWIVLVVLAREFLVSGLRSYLESRGTRFGARWEGKTKLVVQAIYCGSVLFYPGHSLGWVALVASVFVWATLAVSVYSAAAYVWSAARLLRAGEQ